MTGQSKIPVAIVGISGYAGQQLARLILKHPYAKLVAGFTSHSGFNLANVLPESAAQSVPIHSLDQNPEKILQFAQPGHLVFLATPPEVSLVWAPQLIEAGCHVIDLSGAFRLSEVDALKWYGVPKENRSFLAQAEYGLVPWNGPMIGDFQNLVPGRGRLIANPGCYPTCVLMAILPLLREGLIDPDTLVIDAKSGTTGAGRKASQNLLFSEVEGECLPYKVGQHQHFPEICKGALELSAIKIDPFFTTQLLSVRRGMIASIYAKTIQDTRMETLTSAYEKFYRGYPLVNASALDSETSSGLALRRVVGSARVEIRFHLKGGKLTVFSLLDNLMKGAASQAVENFNRIYDFNLATGLTEIEGLL
jgi:N-acetyl-gamma-glutamyl-phosphate reductase